LPRCRTTWRRSTNEPVAAEFHQHHFHHGSRDIDDQGQWPGPHRIVILGGGAGGAAAAQTLARITADATEITLIEEQQKYVTCFFSNLVLGRLRSLESITHGYERLKGIKLVHARATAIMQEEKLIQLTDGSSGPYDTLILSPGIVVDYDSIDGYSEEVAERLPHGWKAGPQTVALRAQLDALKDGARIVMIAQPNPYRCPPGPYERISMIAHLMSSTGRKNVKITILDPKEKFSKQALFLEGWEKHYPGTVQWIGKDVLGAITSLDTDKMAVKAELGNFEADLINPIPRQTAPKLLIDSGLANETQFCPVVPETMQTSIDPAIYVIGDSCIAVDMPKSAFSAASQARTASLTIAAGLAGKSAPEARYFNTCWSAIAPEDSVYIGAAYAPKDGKITSIASFVSQAGESPELRKKTAVQAMDWYDAITVGMFG
jgi:NADPH-dependent 2,4-dienoyl-CoA reductase/sulfur reductase-like enzyme